MTQPSRDTWRVEMVEQETRNGLLHFEYVIREGAREPFLLNNHRAQVRENHQRIVTGPNGGLMHVSGVEVTNLTQFQNDSRYYRWVDKDASGRWRDNRGRVLAPYLFARAPWVGPGDDELDPQWQRETYTLPLAGQVDALLARYQRRAEAKGYVGDRRGTTLNLKVTGENDAHQLSAGTVIVTLSGGSIIDATNEWYLMRWTGVTIAPGSTIDAALLTIPNVGSGNDEPQHDFWFEDADDAAAPVASNNDISGRSRTTATYLWDDADLGAGSGTSMIEVGATTAAGAGADLSALPQEVIGRGGWASGNAMVCVMAGRTGTRDLAPDSVEANSAFGAELDIDYTAGGGGGTAIKDIIGGGFILFPR